jgi:hypothetical protein
VEGECVRKRGGGGVCGAFIAVAPGKWCASDGENAASKILLMACRSAGNGGATLSGGGPYASASTSLSGGKRE